MNKTDLSLILSTLGVLLALKLTLVAALILAAFVAGVLVGHELRHPP